MSDYNLMGNRIRKARKEKGYTQEELSEAVGISASFLSNIETGVKPCAFDTLVRLAKALDVTLDYLSQDIIPAASENENDRKFLELYNKLDHKKQKLVLKIMEDIDDFN